MLCFLAKMCFSQLKLFFKLFFTVFVLNKTLIVKPIKYSYNEQQENYNEPTLEYKVFFFSSRICDALNKSSLFKKKKF